MSGTSGVGGINQPFSPQGERVEKKAQKGKMTGGHRVKQGKEGEQAVKVGETAGKQLSSTVEGAKSPPQSLSRFKGKTKTKEFSSSEKSEGVFGKRFRKSSDNQKITSKTEQKVSANSERERALRGLKTGKRLVLLENGQLQVKAKGLLSRRTMKKAEANRLIVLLLTTKNDPKTFAETYDILSRNKDFASIIDKEKKIADRDKKEGYEDDIGNLYNRWQKAGEEREKFRERALSGEIIEGY